MLPFFRCGCPYKWAPNCKNYVLKHPLMEKWPKQKYISKRYIKNFHLKSYIQGKLYFNLSYLTFF